MADGPDLGALLQQAQQMQQQLLAAQAQAAEVEHEGTAGGGAVKVTVTGGMEFRSVTIRPDAVDPDDVEMLQDLVLAALNEAVGKVTDAQQHALGGLGGMLGGGGLGGLLGQ
jgi:DNA-binding YbaB/EbfC family protein